MLSTVGVSIGNSLHNEQAVTGPEDAQLLLLSSLLDSDTTLQCSVNAVDTNKDEIEYDFLVTRENFHFRNKMLRLAQLDTTAVRIFLWE